MTRKDGIYDIAVIGARGTGKTSLIASMYGLFNDQTALHGLQLVAADPRTTQYLSESLGRLEMISSEIVVREPGIGSNPLEFKDLEFDLRVVGKDKRCVRIRFTDYPGEWTAVNQDLRERVGGSPVVLVAIDAPALMWEDGKLNGLWNTPRLISQALSDWLDDKSTGKQLVMFCPVKCESWVQDEASQQQLEQRVKAQFKSATGALERHPKTRVLYSPVQTTGSLRHNRFDKLPNGDLESKFLGTPNGRYAPQWVLNPLISALAAVGDQVGTDETLWDFIWRRNSMLKKMAGEFYRRSLEGPAKVWQ